MSSFSASVIAGADDFTKFYASTFNATYDWMGMGNVAGSADAGLRIQDVTIPHGALVSDARLYIYMYATEGGVPFSIVSRIYMVKEASHTSPPTTYAEWAADALTTAYVAWDYTSVTSGTELTSTNWATVAQEIFDQEDWDEGGDIGIRLLNYNALNAGFAYLAPYEHATWAAPRITITYTVPSDTVGSWGMQVSG